MNRVLARMTVGVWVVIMYPSPDNPENRLVPAELPEERVRDITPAGGTQQSIADLAAAVATNQGDLGQERKFSTDERPPDAVIRRSRSAALLVVVLAIAGWVGVRSFRPPPPPIPGDPLEVVAILSPADLKAPALAPEWGTGHGESGVLGESQRAVRIGGLIVELERAAARDDSLTAEADADGIAALVAEVPDGAEVAGLFASVDGARASASRRALEPLVRAAPLALGAWIQGARVAAAAHDGGFFASVRSRESLRLLLLLHGAGAEVEAARDRLDKIVRRRGLPDFPAVSGALDILQRELAN